MRECAKERKGGGERMRRGGRCTTQHCGFSQECHLVLAGWVAQGAEVGMRLMVPHW